MIITPRQFAMKLVEVVVNDPGCQNKAMLFYIGDGLPPEELEFEEFTSNARVTVLKLKRRETGNRIKGNKR